MPSLNTALQAALEPLGFKRNRSGTRFTRTIEASLQTLGLRKSRTGDRESAIYCSMGPSEDEVEIAIELSPVAPMKNTYWWPAMPSDIELRQLHEQLERVVVPFFSAVPALFDEQLARTKAHSQLERFLNCESPFARKDDSYWRRRGPLIDIVDVEFLAQARFAFVYVASWHESIADGIDGEPPEGVTRTASTTLGVGGADAIPNTTLYFLGPEGQAGNRIGDTDLVGVALAYFASIQIADDVFERIRPEYRRFFVR